MSYLRGILLLSAAFFPYARNVNFVYYCIVLKGSESFSHTVYLNFYYYEVFLVPLLDILLLRFMDKRLFWFTTYWVKEFHTSIWMPNLVYFKGFDLQVVLFIFWKLSTFHIPHIRHTITVSQTAIWFLTTWSYVETTELT